jgi:hypothetical protein
MARLPVNDPERVLTTDEVDEDDEFNVGPEPTEITEPGVYELSHAEYHADPVPGGSLSSTGARRLLPPSCPAKFDYARRHPEEPKLEFDLGNAAHDAVLGGGPEVVVVDAANWRKKADQEAAADARARGAVPILRDQWTEVLNMRDALMAHPFAGKLFDAGTAEASLFWLDEPSGVTRRARLDWLPETRRGRMIIPDLKTAISANPDDFARQAANFGYHQQGAWYRDGVRALDLAGDDAVFVFVVQEKTPPYVVSVVQLDAAAMRIGAALNRKAIDIYADCDRTGIWPGYVDDVALASLPRWYEMQHEEDAT